MQETTFYLQRSGLGVFDKVARLRSPTGNLEHLSKEASPEARSAPKVGSFSDIDGHLVCLFRLEGALWLRIDDLLVRADEDVHAGWEQWKLPNGRLRAMFRLTKAGEELYSLEYPPFGAWRLGPDDPPPYISEEEDKDYDEDCDYLFFVTNVLEEPGRRHRFFNQPYLL